MVATASILLVDDDAEDQAIMADALAELDETLPVYFEQSGIEALERLEVFARSGALPCLLVIDLNMPKMGGAEILVFMKSDERFKNIPVVIYSTSNNETEKAACLRLGAHDYITKPLSYKESIEVARHLIQICHKLTNSTS